MQLDHRDLHEVLELDVSPFTTADQDMFGCLSGDLNPVHLDPVAARRTIFGQPIVHGMHLVLRAMEAVNELSDKRSYQDISARFHRPAFLGEHLRLEVLRRRESLDANCYSDGLLLTAISLKSPGPVAKHAWEQIPVRWRTQPLDPTVEALATKAGKLQLPYEEATVRKAFPATADVYGVNAIAHLLAITRVVGMEAPGLNSMFATFSVRLRGGGGSELSYAVGRVTPKISYVQLKFDSPVLSGVAETFIRPIIQPPIFRDLAKSVTPGEFSDRRTLIVGGSRGLGLSTAYILGAGGADVIITYRVGEAEALSAVETMKREGVNARTIRLDVATPETIIEALACNKFDPTDLYYFPTPHIFLRKKALFEADVLKNMIDVYVHQFLSLVDRVARLSTSPLSVFYPSSEAINEPLKDLAEYYIAKVAGEAACEMLARFHPHVFPVVERLPRLPTDQTASLMTVASGDTASLLLEICRKMVSRSNGRPYQRNTRTSE